MKTRAIAPLLLLLCLFVSVQVSANKKTNISKRHKGKEMTQKRYCFLRAVQQTIDGDTYEYSEVIEFNAKDWKKNRAEILEQFETILEDKYDGSTFEVTLECVHGIFKSKEEASLSRDKEMKAANEQMKKLQDLQNGKTVRF